LLLVAFWPTASDGSCKTGVVTGEAEENVGKPGAPVAGVMEAVTTGAEVAGDGKAGTPVGYTADGGSMKPVGEATGAEEEGTGGASPETLKINSEPSTETTVIVMPVGVSTPPRRLSVFG
jgi:hypothetical protein